MTVIFKQRTAVSRMGMRTLIIKSTILLLFCWGAGSSDDDVKKIVLDEVQIEGKIRRPQLILIQAEQRPDFGPMIMRNLDSTIDISEFIDKSIIEKSPYKNAFMFVGTKISNYEP